MFSCVTIAFCWGRDGGEGSGLCVLRRGAKGWVRGVLFIHCTRTGVFLKCVVKEGVIIYYSAVCVGCRGRKRYVSEGDGGAIKAPED